VHWIKDNILWLITTTIAVLTAATAVVALVISVMARKDGKKNADAAQDSAASSRRSADASERSAKAAEDTAAEERAQRLLEEKRHHEERKPKIELGELATAGGGTWVPLRYNGPHLEEMRVTLEQVRGFGQPFHLAGPEWWTVADVKAGDVYDIKVTHPETSGGATRFVCTCVAPDGEIWEVTPVVKVPAVGARVRLRIERRGKGLYRLINEGPERAINVKVLPDPQWAGLERKLPESLNLGHGEVHEFIIIETGEMSAPSVVRVTWTGGTAALPVLG
jgi:hypothetical protein